MKNDILVYLDARYIWKQSKQVMAQESDDWEICWNWITSTLTVYYCPVVLGKLTYLYKLNNIYGYTRSVTEEGNIETIDLFGFSFVILQVGLHTLAHAYPANLMSFDVL